MTRKIRNLAGEPVGAKEADRELRRLWREQEEKIRREDEEWRREQKQKQKRERELEWKRRMDGGYSQISYSEDELVSRYFAHRLIIDPNSSVVSAELTQDFFKWASERNFRVNRSLVVRMISESFLVSITYAEVIRQACAPVTDNLLARLDTNNPPTSKSVTVWHGLRWADDDAEELI